jgi:hypothetical protein
MLDLTRGLRPSATLDGGQWNGLLHEPSSDTSLNTCSADPTSELKEDAGGFRVTAWLRLLFFLLLFLEARMLDLTLGW